MQVAVRIAFQYDLLPALSELRSALAEKAAAFDHIVKSGRTHLMDATPIRLGQEFSGFASQIALGMRRGKGGPEAMAQHPRGGRAGGTARGPHPDPPPRAF